MKIQNLDRLQDKLRQATEELSEPATKGNTIVVGYTANYAVYVHEDTEAAHGEIYNTKYAAEIAQGYTKSGKRKRGWKGKTMRGPNQQAKFLERSARELSNSGELGQIVKSVLGSGATLMGAMMAAGQRIMFQSQQIVPVDTGNLKASGFVERE